MTHPHNPVETILSGLAQGTRVVELGQPHFTGMACSPNHPGFRMTLIRRHGDMVRSDGGSASNEIIVTGGHVGTHVDALAHVSQDGKLFGGLDAQQTQTGGKFTDLGADKIPVMLTRGVLLDVPKVKGEARLQAGYGVTAEDLQAAEGLAGTSLMAGDVVLVRTGWAQHFTKDPATYLGQVDGVPGPSEDGARYLAAKGVRAVGGDTTAFEQIKPGAGHSVLPVHRILLVENGIHIIEHLNLEAASADGLASFFFVMCPLRIEGGTGSPIRPIAVVAA